MRRESAPAPRDRLALWRACASWRLALAAQLGLGVGCAVQPAQPADVDLSERRTGSQAAAICTMQGDAEYWKREERDGRRVGTWVKSGTKFTYAFESLSINQGASEMRIAWETEDGTSGHTRVQLERVTEADSPCKHYRAAFPVGARDPQRTVNLMLSCRLDQLREQGLVLERLPSIAGWPVAENRSTGELEPVPLVPWIAHYGVDDENRPFRVTTNGLGRGMHCAGGLRTIASAFVSDRRRTQVSPIDRWAGHGGREQVADSFLTFATRAVIMPENGRIVGRCWYTVDRISAELRHHIRTHGAMCESDLAQLRKETEKGKGQGVQQLLDGMMLRDKPITGTSGLAAAGWVTAGLADVVETIWDCAEVVAAAKAPALVLTRPAWTRLVALLGCGGGLWGVGEAATRAYYNARVAHVVGNMWPEHPRMDLEADRGRIEFKEVEPRTHERLVDLLEKLGKATTTLPDGAKVPAWVERASCPDPHEPAFWDYIGSAAARCDAD